MKKKVLLIRLDKIGDLVSTLCVDQVKVGYGEPLAKNMDVTWCIQKGLSFVADLAAIPRNYFELDKSKASEARKLLRKNLKENSYDVVVSFQAPWWVHFECWLARVPVRAGVLSKWDSFLFLNKGLRQKRSQALQHEADYNRELLEHALDLEPQETPVLLLETARNLELLKKHQLTDKKYVVVHPGMAGSARNWPTENYIQLIQEVIKTHMVVLTGTAMDEPYLAPIKKQFENHKQVKVLQNILSTQELLQILKSSLAVVAPSTGVAHLSAALGAKTIGIYPPVLVQHPRRWAARGDHVQILSPSVNCPAKFSCLGEKCADYDCMKKIAPDDVYRKI